MPKSLRSGSILSEEAAAAEKRYRPCPTGPSDFMRDALNDISVIFICAIKLKVKRTVKGKNPI